MKKYKTVIVEDEVNNIKLLKHFIDKYCPNLEVLGLAKTVNEAKSVIKQVKPEIVFLDVVLKNEIIFNLFEFVNPKDFQIIFTTAYQKYAIEAFRVNAIDYLTKPLDINFLKEAVKKAINNIENKYFISQTKLSEIRDTIETKQLKENYLSIPSKNEVALIKQEDIIYLSSVRKYTVFHIFDSEEIVSTSNIGFYEEILKENNFYRIHNSYIVNLNFLNKLKKLETNFCELTTGEVLPIARRRYKNLKLKLNI